MNACELLLSSALEYHNLKVCVIPAKFQSKQPAIGAKKYFQERPDEATLRQWFGDADSGQLGIAVVCGTVSGGLLVRDFDQASAYAAWKRRHARLAKTLPTVATARGMHVWARAQGYLESPGASFIHKYPDGSGELRGDRHIVIAPPSWHSSAGKVYRWAVEPETIPEVELHVFGYTPTNGECNSLISVLHPGSGILPLPDAFPKDAVARAIKLTLPDGPGQRNDKLFQFARHLKAIPELAAMSADELMPAVECWWQAALPYVRTKDFAVTAKAFRHGWTEVRTPAGGEGSIKRALQRAISEPLPPEAAAFYVPELRLLVALCKQLQAERGRPSFYLGCRDAAAAIGIRSIKGTDDHVRTWRMLEKLCRVGVLRKIRSGSLKDHLVNEYRYLGK